MNTNINDCNEYVHNCIKELTKTHAKQKVTIKEQLNDKTDYKSWIYSTIMKYCCEIYQNLLEKEYPKEYVESIVSASAFWFYASCFDIIYSQIGKSLFDDFFEKCKEIYIKDAIDYNNDAEAMEASCTHREMLWKEALTSLCEKELITNKQKETAFSINSAASLALDSECKTLSKKTIATIAIICFQFCITMSILSLVLVITKGELASFIKFLIGTFVSIFVLSFIPKSWFIDENTNKEIIKTPNIGQVLDFSALLTRFIVLCATSAVSVFLVFGIISACIGKFKLLLSALIVFFLFLLLSTFSNKKQDIITTATKALSVKHFDKNTENTAAQTVIAIFGAYFIIFIIGFICLYSTSHNLWECISTATLVCNILFFIGFIIYISIFSLNSFVQKSKKYFKIDE